MFLRRALRYRWAQALVLTGISLLIGACAVFGPWFARAVEQTVMTETLSGQRLPASWLLASTTDGILVVARMNPQKYEEVRRYQIAESALWAHRAITGSSIVVKDVDKVICWSF